MGIPSEPHDDYQVAVRDKSCWDKKLLTREIKTKFFHRKTREVQTRWSLVEKPEK